MSQRIDTQLGNRRQAYLDHLYKLDGRLERSHPCHGLYTGLLQQRRQQLLAADMEFSANL